MLKNKKSNGIGTRKESSLHRSLKFQYADCGIETQVGDYVCDGLTSEGEIIEVQTGSFGPLKKKVKNLVKSNKVRIIHPIINEKYIELYDQDGKLLHIRKSPKKTKTWNLFAALVYAPELPLLKNLTIELAVINVNEKRINDGTGSWWRKGVRTADRSLRIWLYSIVLQKPKDYRQFIPFKKNELFTARDLKKKAGINLTLAQKTLYVLCKMHLVELAGKSKNAYVYKLKTKNPALKGGV